MIPYRMLMNGEDDDPFGGGGITHQLDSMLHSLRAASEEDDSLKYASLASQLAVILRPKLSPEEFERLSQANVVMPIDETKSHREKRREWKRLLMIASRHQVAELLYLVSKRGIYAKRDKSEEPPADGKGLALED
jgi:hypothetical protein